MKTILSIRWTNEGLFDGLNEEKDGDGHQYICGHIYSLEYVILGTTPL